MFSNIKCLKNRLKYGAKRVLHDFPLLIDFFTVRTNESYGIANVKILSNYVFMLFSSISHCFPLFEPLGVEMFC